MLGRRPALEPSAETSQVKREALAACGGATHPLYLSIVLGGGVWLGGAGSIDGMVGAFEGLC